MKLLKLNSSLLDNLNYRAQSAMTKRQAICADTLHSVVAILGDTTGPIEVLNDIDKYSPVFTVIDKNVPAQSISSSTDIIPQPPPTEKRSNLANTPNQRNRRQVDNDTQTIIDEQKLSSTTSLTETDQDCPSSSSVEIAISDSGVPIGLQASVELLPHSSPSENKINENSTSEVNRIEVTGSTDAIESSSEADNIILKEVQAKKWKKINILKELDAEKAAEALTKAESRKKRAAEQHVDLSDATISRYIDHPP